MRLATVHSSDTTLASLACLSTLSVHICKQNRSLAKALIFIQLEVYDSRPMRKSFRIIAVWNRCTINWELTTESYHPKPSLNFFRSCPPKVSWVLHTHQMMVTWMLLVQHTPSRKRPKFEVPRFDSIVRSRI